MRHGKLTKEDAIKEAGREAMDRVDNENCEPTSRVDSVLDNENVVEFSATIYFLDDDLIERTLTKYYYPDSDEVRNSDGDLSLVNWDCVQGYEID